MQKRRKICLFVVAGFALAAVPFYVLVSSIEGTPLRVGATVQDAWKYIHQQPWRPGIKTKWISSASRLQYNSERQLFSTRVILKRQIIYDLDTNGIISNAHGSWSFVMNRAKTPGAPPSFAGIHQRGRTITNIHPILWSARNAGAAPLAKEYYYYDIGTNSLEISNLANFLRKGGINLGPSDLIFMNSQLVVKATPDEDKRIAELLAILNYQTSARDEGNRKTK